MSNHPLSEPHPRGAKQVEGRKTGVLIGGSGLVGGTLLLHLKTSAHEAIDVLAPNSKELSIRAPGDIRAYFERVRPDFIINCAIATLDSNPELTFEVNCMGAVYLAQAARDLGIPYIHISSAAFLPNREDIPEDEDVEPTPRMSNYAKGKLLAERAIRHIHERDGLDYTIIRLAVVYGAHDHKIQGFHRLLFSVANGSMPALFTTRTARHSYTNAKKLPHFVAHVLANRSEFTGQAFHFTDPEPVPLAKLILTVKALMNRRRPTEIYVPLPLARIGVVVLTQMGRLSRLFGVETHTPAERIFLRNFYESQTLSRERLRRSSFVDPDPEMTIFSELPELIRYYVQRWEQLNLVGSRRSKAANAESKLAEFTRSPDQLVSSILAEQESPFLRQCPVAPPDRASQDIGTI